MTNVTRPYLPPLAEFLPLLEDIWQSGTLSNNGPYQRKFEAELAARLGCQHVSVFCIATIALMVAQKALSLEGEIITTPYTFVATSNAIQWMGNTPVFVDIDPESLCIDPARIEAAITPSTVAIMPLHCYGNNCNAEAIDRIAARHSLKVIYDACHSFYCEDEQGSALRYGDISVVSFHATKVFNTFEGGLLISREKSLKSKVDRLKNFGFVDEITVREAGINGKMSEFNAALGLLQLGHLELAIQERAAIDEIYRTYLNDVKGIRCQEPIRVSRQNFSYFPIFVESDFGVSRDQLYDCLRQEGIYARRYFYPIVPDLDAFSGQNMRNADTLSVARQASLSVLCLPIYPGLAPERVIEICKLIAEVGD